jgi:long-chain acyl-CoA synthetase
MSRARLVLEGEVALGEGLQVGAGPVPVQLVAAPGASITLGADCFLELGTAVFAQGPVRLGDRVRCAPHVVIGAPEGASAEPIEIGDDVELGPRAVVLPGTRLAAGSAVFAGSVASGEVPPLSLVVGNPGRVEPRPLSPLAERALHEALDATTHVHGALWLVAQRAPTRVALRRGAEEQTYAQVLARAQAVRVALEHLGVRPGMRVLVGCAEKDAFLAGFYALSLLGAVAVPLVDGVSRVSVEEIVAATGARVCVTTAASARVLGGALAGLTLLHAEACVPERDLAGRVPADVPPSAPALVLFTSGTTARKKGVVLTHAALVQATRSINAFMQLDAAVREYVAVPLTHSFGLGRVRALFARAATAVVSDGLVSPPAIAEAMRAGRCDGLSAVPAVLALFQGRSRPLLDELGARLRFVELGSAPLPAEARRRLMAAFPRARLCMHYGLTEASRSAFLEFHGEAAHLHTVGRASPGVVLEIQGDDGRPLPAGQEGEIVVRGGHLASEYLGDPERTRTAFAPDGFHTGDYGVLDAEGYLTLLGRRDEMINSGGLKISPLELEGRIRALHPALDFCVLGLPDPAGLAGEVAAVVAVGAAGLTLADLNRSLQGSVDRGRLPRLLLHADSLPRTENGKVKRRELRQALAGG